MKLKLLYASVSLITASFFFNSNIVNAQSGLENSFGTDGEVNTNIGDGFAEIRTVIELNDSKLLAIGTFEANGGANDDQVNLAVARYSANGSLDTTFGTNGTTIFQVSGLGTFVEDGIVDASGRILIVGGTLDSAENERAFLLRLLANGSLDNSFGTNGVVITNYNTTMAAFASSVLLQSNGSIVIAGAVFRDEANSQFVGNYALARYNTSGVLDTTFGSSGVTISDFDTNRAEIIFSLNLQSDGKLIAAGNSFLDNGANTNPDDDDVIAARYNVNGSLDTAFGVNGLGTVNFTNQSTFVSDSKLQADGKIVIAGDIFDAVSDDFLIVRLNADGSVDNTFDTDGIVTTNFIGSDDGIQEGVAVNILADGKLLIIGDVNNSTTSTDFIGIARYLTNGTLDSSFRDDGQFLFQSDNAFLSDAIIVSGDLLAAGSNTTGSSSSDDFYLAKFLLSNTLSLEYLIETEISVYPNPVKEFLTVNFGELATETELTLFNILGKKVFTITAQKALETLNIASLAKGVYLLKITQNDQSKTFKVLKD